MRIVLGAFLLAAVTATSLSLAASPEPGGLVAGKTTVAEAMQSFGAPADTKMSEDGALTLFYPGERVGRANRRLVALHFGADFVYHDSRYARAVVTVTDLASR
jgi:hypothetical protein